MALRDHSPEKTKELSNALIEEALGANVQRFLTKCGVTTERIAVSGGWMVILLDMVPKMYPDIAKLVEAIRAS